MVKAKIYDCTRRVFPEMAVYPNTPSPEIVWRSSTAQGHRTNESQLVLGAHTGTHVDAPFHFIADGANLSEFDVSHFYGPCRLIAVSDEVSVVTKAELESYSPAKGEILLIKTRNSSFSEDEPFRKDYVALDISAGEYLAECGVKTIGIDYLSVENPINKSGVHLIILGAGIGIIEGLMLKDVPAGQYFLSALPLRVEGVEGSPVRAVLFDFDR